MGSTDCLICLFVFEGYIYFSFWKEDINSGWKVVVKLIVNFIYNYLKWSVWFCRLGIKVYSKI